MGGGKRLRGFMPRKSLYCFHFGGYLCGNRWSV